MKRFTKGLLVVLVAAGILAGAASPSSAATGVAVFTGTAATSALTIVPGANGPNGTWSITVPGCTAVEPAQTCGFHAEGSLAGVPGISPVTPGPACGSSSGKSDPALSTFGSDNNLNVSWQASAGSLIVITGSSSSTSTIVALVQASPTPTPTGTLNCLGTGATSFDVRGVSAFAS